MEIDVFVSPKLNLVGHIDRNSFIHLYDLYAPAVFGEVMRTVQDKRMAENLLYEIFMEAWRKGDEYDPEKGRLFTWILSITRKRCSDHVGKAKSIFTNKEMEIVTKEKTNNILI